MSLLLLVVVLLLFGVAAPFTGLGNTGLVLIIVVILYLFGALHWAH